MPMLNAGMVTAENASQHMLQKIGWQMVNLRIESRNAFRNWHILEEGHYAKRVLSMEDCPKGKGPIVVIGSGSSVDPIMTTLKDWKGAVMCSTSHMSTLAYYGRPTDYIVCMDPRVAVPDKEMDYPDYGDSVLLTHVSAPPEYVQRWLQRANGKIFVSRIMEPSYEWYTHHLGEGYPWVRHVIVPMIDSLAAEISFATWLGYNPIYLAGADYGGPRFQMWTYDYQTKAWKPDVETSGYVAGPGTGEEGMTYSSRGSMLSGFMQIANETYQQRIYQLSEATILKQFPYRNWKRVLAGHQPGSFDRQLVLDEIECALASWDTFLCRVNTGWGNDYHTYITADENRYMGALAAYNQQLKKNLEHFEYLEKVNGKPLLAMMRSGQVSIEAGELLLRGADEFGDWDWRKMELIDIPAVLSRRRWLVSEFPKRGYKPPPPLNARQRKILEVDTPVAPTPELKAGVKLIDWVRRRVGSKK